MIDPAPLTRELHSRTVEGIDLRLMWSSSERQLWVTVTDHRAGAAFRVEVRDGERPLDVFHHPYAYAACHGIDPHPAAEATPAAALPA
jgi:hypothetical protein